MLPLLLALSVASAAPTKRKPDAERGKALYAAHCWMCHGKRALGDGPSRTLLGPAAPPLAGRVPASTWSAHVELIQEGRGAMPGFSALIGREETRCILEWLTALDPETGKDPKGDQAPAKPSRRSTRPDADPTPDADADPAPPASKSDG